MTESKEAFILLLEAYAAGINETCTTYRAFVDVSGAIPQLCIR